MQRCPHIARLDNGRLRKNCAVASGDLNKRQTLRDRKAHLPRVDLNTNERMVIHSPSPLITISRVSLAHSQPGCAAEGTVLDLRGRRGRWRERAVTPTLVFTVIFTADSAPPYNCRGLPVF